MRLLLPASLALSLRSFRRAPGFLAVAPLSLGAALRLSATTAMYMGFRDTRYRPTRTRRSGGAHGARIPRPAT